MISAWYKNAYRNLLDEFRDPERIIFWALLLIIICLTAAYRWYQPLTERALLQFDIFDWARQSKEWLVLGHMLTPTTLWFFPMWNAIAAKVTGLDLFSIYLFSGAFLTTFNLLVLYGISVKFWKKPILRLIPLILYAVNTQLLSRSVNYLPETMSFTFGLVLVYLYVRLIFDRKLLWLVPIGILNYFYYHLHQSGTNFLIFTVVVVIIYILGVSQQSWKRKLIMLGIFCLLGIGFVATNVGIQQQIQFFLNGSSNADIAFQGVPIPLKQISTDYPYIFYGMLLLGTFSILYNTIRYRFTQRNIASLVVLGITLFYFAFLYVLPNLKIYSLVPWRFYTWFSLYAIYIVAEGVAFLYSSLQSQNVLRALLVPSFLVINLMHGTLISDNMYTANAATLHSMENIELPKNSIVITTNANYLQAKYAFVGKDAITTTQAGPELFRSAHASTASAYVTGSYSGKSVYVLISLYQLRQRPSNIAYWSNSAMYDMNLDIFSDKKYFLTEYIDENIVLYRSVSAELRK